MQTPVVIVMDDEMGPKKRQWGTDEDPLAAVEEVVEEKDDGVW